MRSTKRSVSAADPERGGVLQYAPVGRGDQPGARDARRAAKDEGSNG